MDLFIKAYLNLIVLSFITGLFVTAFRKKNGQSDAVSKPIMNSDSLQNNMELFSGIDINNIQNIVDVSANDETEYDVPVIYAVVDVEDTADQRSAL